MDSSTGAQPARPRGLKISGSGEEVRPYKKARLMSSLEDTITLLVGSEKKKLLVHKKVLCAASPFFESACKPEWLKDEGITLPEDEPEVVQMMIGWMYTNELTIADHGKDDILLKIIKLYILGQKYQIPMLRNDTLDAISVGAFDEILTGESIACAWQHTPESCALRVFLMRAIKSCIRGEDLWSKSNPDIPVEFWICLAAELMEQVDQGVRNQSVPESFGSAAAFCASYHVHEEGKGFCQGIKACEVVKGQQLDE